MDRLKYYWRQSRAALKFYANLSIPFYVTRKTASGMIGTWSVSAIPGLLILFLGMFNAIFWGIWALLEVLGRLF
jgi:hypothetical protein